MKNVIYKIGVLVAVLVASLSLFWIGCDKIDEPYRITNVEPVPEGSDTLKVVFIEDFTGIKCVNCPEAAKIIEDLQAIHKGRIISLGIHAGIFAKPSAAPYDTDLRSDEGTEYLNTYKVQSFPQGLINKKEGAKLYNSGDWTNEILSEMEVPTSVRMGISATLTGKEIKCTVTYKAVKELSGDHKLLVYLVEDGIVAAQKNNNASIGPTDILDYKHHNVLRETLNSTWGQSIGSLSKGEEVKKDISHTIKSSKKSEDSTYKLIAIIYNSETQYVEQAAEFAFED